MLFYDLLGKSKGKDKGIFQHNRQYANQNSSARFISLLKIQNQ
jgi:hypothetical protein